MSSTSLSLQARYLGSFDVKLAELRQATGRLGGTDDAQAATAELRRLLQNLAGSGEVYGIPEVSAWARETLRAVEVARARPGLVSSADVDDLQQRISVLALLVTRIAESHKSSAVSNVPPALPVALTEPANTWSDGPDDDSGGRGPDERETDPGPGPAEANRRARGAAGSLSDALAWSTILATDTVQAPVGGASAPLKAPADRVSEPTTPLELAAAQAAAAQAPPPEAAPAGSTDQSADGRGAPPPLPVQEIAVLVIDGDRAVHSGVQAALSDRPYRVSATADADAGLEMARSETPDLIFLGQDVEGANWSQVLERIRKDPLTQFVPVVLVANEADLTERSRGLEAGAADYLPKPFVAEDVIDRVRRIAVELGPEPEGVPDLGSAPLPEVVRFIEREMRRGLLDSAETGSDDLRIPLGRGAEILAATWSAVARLRELIARLSDGKVRFRAVDHGRLGVLALHDEEHVAVSSPDPSPGPSPDLAGRLVLVADDDPAVRLLFTKVLGDVGATVETAEDGRAALVRARARRPDLIVSDILMPTMDGWELCRAVRRDFALRDVPFVFLSLKEDFFQRMKELSADADGYLLKDAQRSQILDRLRQLLRPRALLEARLPVGSEVHGRVDATGILTLLRAVARVRGDAKLSVRENWNLFELELKAGRPVSCTRTATDGSFERGASAFIEMLAIDGGRYSVGPATQGARPNLEGELEELIASCTNHLNGLARLVHDAALMRIVQIDLQPETLAPYVAAAPVRVRRVVEALQNRTTPRELVLGRGIGAQELESVLLDLIKRGGVLAIDAPAPEYSAPRTSDAARSQTIAAEDHVTALPAPTHVGGAVVVANPSPAPARPPPLHPVLPAEGRVSLAPWPAESLRPGSARVKLGWALVVVAGLAGIALWAYILMGTQRPPIPHRELAVPAEQASAPAAELLQAAQQPQRVQVPEQVIPVARSRHEQPAPPPPSENEGTRGEEGARKRPRGQQASERQSPPPESAAVGTLRVTGPAGTEGTHVIVDGQPKGTTPLDVSVPGGLHEVRLQRGEHSILRYVFVPAGESRRLIVPSLEPPQAE